MNPTPTISVHARQRCREMGVSTKVPKAIVRQPSVVYESKIEGRMVMFSDRYPRYAVIWHQPSNLVVSLLFRESEEYVRLGAGYVIEERT